ncbi:hypothetical protein Dda_6353 [Drechslerella dactyloides]|uniref:GPI anchored serine-threonine rich protein n=1 Tax=Drechslerella dactyloides TaxID=74499 RepID=A0AAD6ITP7_DREDA|nr:hypothetical protein Dda_6353 [Drechslerella dactyloides]
MIAFLNYLAAILLFSSAALAKIADPRQNHVKKIDLSKRQDSAGGLVVGASCAEITGNPDDKICAISTESVSCAPVCCIQRGEFVDGCPAGDRCDFASDGLKCCPANDEECGPRPTACVDFGKPTAINLSQVMCPSATPSCTTRNDGGAACTGSEDDISKYPTSTSFENTSKAKILKPLVTPIITSSIVCTSAKATPRTSSTSSPSRITSRDMLDTATMTQMPSMSTSASVTILSTSSSVPRSTRAGTMTLSIADPTTESAPPAVSSAQAGNGVEIKRNPAFGLLVAVGVGMGVFL